MSNTKVRRYTVVILAGMLAAVSATTLQVTVPPLADTARYDRLRPQDDAEEIDHA